MEDANYVFVNELGKLYRPQYISNQWSAFVKSFGLRPIDFKEIRHTNATLLREQGVPLEDISKWLGHSSTAVTEKVYAQMTLKKKMESASALNAVFNITPTKEKL